MSLECGGVLLKKLELRRSLIGFDAEKKLQGRILELQELNF
jgi:hypothetical protein